MNKSRYVRRVAATVLAVIVGGSLFGCAAPYRNGRTGEVPPGGGGAPGAGAPGVGAPGVGAPGAGAPGVGANLFGGQTQSDLGQLVASYVAGNDGFRRSGVGVGAARDAASVAASALIVGNVAYVGIDPATVPPGAGTAGGTAATPGAPPVGVDRAAAGPGGTPGVITPGTNGAPGGAVGSVGLEEHVRTMVRAGFPQIAEVFVTTDPGLVSRIARVTGEIQQGQSAANRIDEIMTITREMTPQAGGRSGGGS